MKKTLKLSFLLLFFFGVNNIFAQTGPGGVGKSTGSTGQPENVIWFDANQLSLSNNDPVSIWNDVSGNLNNGTQLSINEQPIFKTGQLNGLPAIVFDPSGGAGNQDFIPFNGNLIANTDYTIVFVGKRRTNSWMRIAIAGTNTGTNNNLHIYWNNSSQFRAHHYGNDLQTNMVTSGTAYDGGTDPNTYGIFTTLLASSDASDNRRNYQNNHYLGSITDNQQLNSWDGAALGRAIFGSSEYYSDVDFAEVIIFSNALNDAQLQIVHQYLEVKYAITIDNDLYSPNSAYVYDVAGIGEEINGEHSEASSAGLYMTALSGLNLNDYVFTSHNNSPNSSSDFVNSDLPAGVELRYNRIWYAEDINSPEFRLAFDFDEAVSDGLYPVNYSNYVLLYRNSTSGAFSVVQNADGIADGDKVYFDLNSTEFQSGYYTLATEDETNSPLQGSPGRTWYSLVSGDWDNWEVWTLDPSGALPNNPDMLTPTTSPTSTADKVVILSGKTITVNTNNKKNSTILVNGRLDINTTTGHTFGEIKGYGKIILQGDNFPSGTATHFVTEGQGEGTVVYEGTSYNLSTAREFYDVEVILTSGETITLLNDYQINGNLTIETGTVQINDATDNQLINLTIEKDVTILADGSITVGTGNPFLADAYVIGTKMPVDDGKLYHDIYHQFKIGGNLTNNGIIKLTNQTDPDYDDFTTNGAVTVTFFNASNNTVTLNNTSWFYNFVVDKGNSKTYILELFSSDVANFELFGANTVGRNTPVGFSADNPQVRKALFIKNGTLKFTGNIHIPTLTEGGESGGNGDYAVGKNAGFWIADSGVTIYTTAEATTDITDFTIDWVGTGGGVQAMSMYGEYKITDGFFGTRNSAGFIFWSSSNASIIIEGGTTNVAQFRSGGSGGGIASYYQNGGTLIVRGNQDVGGSVDGSFPLFGFESDQSIFRMLDGNIILNDNNGNNNVPDYYIPCSEGNYSVTGGKVHFNFHSNNDMIVQSTANFYDMEVSRLSGSGTSELYLADDLKVTNILTVNSDTELNTESPLTGYFQDVTVGDQFILNAGGTYTANSNTTSFEYNGHSDFYNEGTITNGLYNVNVDIRSNFYVRNNDLLVRNNFNLVRGRLNLSNNITLTVRGNILNNGNENSSNSSKVLLTDGGVVSGITVTNNGGDTYSSPPTVTIDAPAGGGITATAVAIINGKVSSITITDGGDYNRADPTITIAPPANGGTQATATLTTTETPAGSGHWVITGVTITDQGSGYQTAPNISTSWNGGEAGNYNATLTADILGNVVDVLIDENGTTYTSVPTVTIAGAATATATINTEHLISGDDDCSFKNLELDEIPGIQARLLTDHKVSTELTITDGIFDLNTKKLTLDGSLGSETLTDYDNTRMLQTAGNSSDGGLERYISANGVYLFPTGTDANSIIRYTPTSANVSSYSDDGYIQINTVDDFLQTAITPGGNSLSYYWRIRHNSFSAVPSAVYTFLSADSDDDDDPADGDISISSARVGEILNESPYTRTSLPNPAAVNSPLNLYFITDTRTVSNACYTVGKNACFTGQLKVFYNRVANGMWDDNNTWSNVSHTGASVPGGGGAGNKYPGPGDIVEISGRTEDGLTNIDNVTINIDNAQCAQLIFKSYGGALSSLYINGDDASINSVDLGDVSGEKGRIHVKVDGNRASQVVLNGDYGDFAAEATNEFIFINSSNAEVELPSQISEFPMLRLSHTSGNPSANTFFFPMDVTVNHRMIVHGYFRLENNFILNDGTFNIMTEAAWGAGRTGHLIFPNDKSINIDINGDLIIAREGQIRMLDNNTSSDAIHDLSISGDITMSSTSQFDLYNNSGSDLNVARLNIYGDEDKTFNNSGSGIPDFYRIIMKKDDVNTRFTFEEEFTLNGPTDVADKALQLDTGHLLFRDVAIDVTLTSGGGDFVIPETAKLTCNGGTLRVQGDDVGILLEGALVLQHGTNAFFDEGNNNYIEYTGSGLSSLTMYQGTFRVGSQIRRSLNSETGVLNFKKLHKDGLCIIGSKGGGDPDRATFEILNPGSSIEIVDEAVIYISNTSNNPNVAALYLDPTTSTIGTDATFILGGSETNASQVLEVYSSVELENLIVDNTSGNNPIGKINTLPLILNGDMQIDALAEFDANGLDFTIKGNWTNNGTFTPSDNRTFFSGSTTQHINGTTTFFDFYKNTPNTVNVNDEIYINNEFHLLDGTLADNGNDIFTYGNVFNDGVHDWGGSGNGICLYGTSQQEMHTSGLWGKISINNSNGVLVQTAVPTIDIDDAVQLQNGIFDIGKNMLVLDEDAIFIEASAYGENNMVQTHISFTDNGIKKSFPNAYSDIFIFPIGSEGKYTPVEFNISSTDDGNLRVRAANERHPTIQEDTEPCNEIVDIDNVLQYHWVIEGVGFSNFSATASMKYYDADVSVTAPYDVTDNITAKLLLGTSSWNKYTHADFDEGNNLLKFYYFGTDDYGISGDYTAGVEDPSGNCEGAIPNDIPIYISNIPVGDWNINTNWDTYPISGGSVPAGGPRGAIVIIRAGDEIKMPGNYILNYKTTVDGVLNLGTTYGHRLGYVDGTGEIYAERGELPAAIYDNFILPNTGTFHFGGNSDYDVLSELPIVNNLKFSGTGERRLPNLNIRLEGTLVIDGTNNTLEIINEFDRKIEVRNNITLNNGSFDAGSGLTAILEIGGSNHQRILGTGSFTGSNAFNHFVMNNPDGLTLDRPIDIDFTLDFDEGLIYNDGLNFLTLNSTKPTVVIGGGEFNYVDGIVRKNISSAFNYFDFPIGNNGRYGNIEINNVNLGMAATGYFYSEYFNYNPLDDGYDPESFQSPLEYVSHNEYWMLNGELNSSAYIKLRWDDISGASSDASERDDLRVAEWITTQWETTHNNETAVGTQFAGTVTSANNSVNLLNNHYFTLASVTLLVNVWTGNTSETWDITTNWSKSKVPTSLANAIIPTTPTGGRFPEIDVDAKCLNLDIEPGATVTIKSNGTLTLTGKFNNDGELIIESPNNSGPGGSFIDNGSIGGSGVIKIDRFMTGSEFHYISTPVNTGNETSALFTRSNPSGNFNPNFYKYNEAYDLDGNPTTAPPMPFDINYLVPGWYYAHSGSSGADQDLISKTGYAFYTDADQMITFTGTPNTGDMNISGLTYTPNDIVSDNPYTDIPELYDGWNLVGNPYPSSIDWDVIKTNLTNLDEGIYVWDGSQYANYVNGISSGSGNLSKDIPPMQAFYVRAKANGGAFLLNNTHRTHSNQEYLKGDSLKSNINNLVRIKINANGYENVTNIYFHDNATTNYDGNYDALCLFAQLNEVPDLYTIADNQLRMSTNAMPQDQIGNTTLPLGLRLYTSGEYTINFDEFIGFDNVRVILEDTYLNTFTDMKAITSYTFNHSASNIEDRFVIHFYQNNPPIVVNTLDAVNAIEDQELYILLPEYYFEEIDNFDSLTYSLKLSNNDELPDWMSFNNNNLEFILYPENDNVGDYELVFVATDTYNESAEIIFNLHVENVNDAPILNIPFTDQEVHAFEELNYTIPENAFIDIDVNDSLTYEVTFENGNQLPIWLSYNYHTNTISGTPSSSDVGKYKIKIIATDKFGATADDVFELKVLKNTTNINNQNVSVEVYPNPTNGIFIIETTNQSSKIEIIDALGKTILTTSSNSSKLSIDISTYAVGVYTIKITDQDNNVINRKITLQ